MTDATLTEDQALALLHKLAKDDDFRARFEDKPAKALTEIGLAPGTIIELRGHCLDRVELAPKIVFRAALDTLDKDVIAATMTMLAPRMSLGN